MAQVLLSLPQEQNLATIIMNPNSGTNALAGALGSIIGYLGAEASESSLFERLMWPQRFYNDNTVFGAIKAALLMPMGGPIHKAALETLDGFRKRGLYEGMQQGHMLGTVFFPSTGLKYKIHGYTGTDKDDQVRNGLWVGVMQRLRGCQMTSGVITERKPDAENQKTLVRRTTQRVQHIILSVPESSSEIHDPRIREYSEGHISIGAVATIFCSEITALICAFVVLWIEQCYWFAAYLCIPLVLKLLAVPCSVRREPTGPPETITAPVNMNKILVEVSDYDHGFPLIEGPEGIVRKFFKHWGHPVRRTQLDRVREIASMGLVMAFVFCFPIGLLSMLWVNLNVQIVWLSFQVYTIFAMHVNRLMGLHGPGRMEDSIARSLAQGRIIRLRSNDHSVVEARLESHPVARIAHGQEKVEAIVRNHIESIGLSGVDSNTSNTTLCEKP